MILDRSISAGPRMRRLVLSVAILAAVLALVPRAEALPPRSDPIQEVPVTATTGEKPQSKVWKHDGRWWSVLPNSSGTQLRRLDGLAWTDVLQISSASNSQADVKVAGDLVHILLFEGTNSELVSLEYVDSTRAYRPWSDRSSPAPLTLDSGVETATIDIDSRGRMWLAWDRNNAIRVRYSDPPFESWSSPITVASGIRSDDIGMVVALPNGTVGVMWSNQSAKRFGFRAHVDGDDPANWSADEVPASQSALAIGGGMADDHLNAAVGSDATLYVAVKTSYDTPGYPKIALLVRRPNGVWDDLYEVDQIGTRPIALLDEATGTVSVIYAAVEALSPILYREASTSAIAFGPRGTLIEGALNDVSSTKENIDDDVVVLASTPSVAIGLYLSSPAPQVTLLAPIGGEVWLEDSIHDIQWTAVDATGITEVDLDYSTDGGALWASIVTGIPNSGSYAWTVPNTPTTAARVRVTAHNASGQVASDTSAADFEIRSSTVAVEPLAGGSLSLSPPRPNPFVGRATIEYTLPREAPVRIELFDLAGRRVRALVDRVEGAGVHTITWDGQGESGAAVESGLYLLRLESNGEVRMRKLLRAR